MKIESNFLPYDLSLLIKEKGFDEPCLAYYHYNIHNVFKDNGLLWKLKFRITDKSNSQYCQAPLYQQAIEWLREKHGIHINIITDLARVEAHKYVIVHSTKLNEYGNLCSTYNSALIEAIKESLKLIP